MMIVAPPAPPTARIGVPWSTTIVGLIDERGRLPGPGSFAVPGPEKSVSSLLSRKPVPGATTAEPKVCSIVQVSATALPALSTTERLVVEPFGLASVPAGRAPGGAPAGCPAL